jgi:hypothetical protein
MSTKVFILENNHRYSVYKVGNKRPSRVFDNFDDAISYINQNDLSIDDGGQKKLDLDVCENCTCNQEAECVKLSEPTPEVLAPQAEHYCSEHPDVTSEKLNSEIDSRLVEPEPKVSFWDKVLGFFKRKSSCQ